MTLIKVFYHSFRSRRIKLTNVLEECIGAGFIILTDRSRKARSLLRWGSSYWDLRLEKYAPCKKARNNQTYCSKKVGCPVVIYFSE